MPQSGYIMRQDDTVIDGVAGNLELEYFETWRSNVYMTATDVWKIKKPIQLGSLNYRSLAARERACTDELELNQTLAQDVYHDVVPVVKLSDGRRSIGGCGEVVDYALHMTRLPERDRLDERVRSGRLDDDAIRGVAHSIAAFHERAREIKSGARATLLAAIDLDPPSPLDLAHGPEYPNAAIAAARWQRRFVEEHIALFERRAATRNIRDGHGDLGLEHIFMEDNGAVRIINRLEFDASLREVDVCADIASLSTDLAAAGRADLAEQVLAEYAGYANDFDLYSLIDFYSSLRASIRGKIEWFYADHFEAGPVVENERRACAERYFKLAAAAPRRSLLPPIVVAVGGLVASGKSTVARHLGHAIGAPVVSSDRTRDFLLGTRLTQDHHEVDWERAYEPGFGEKVYNEVMRRAGVVLRSGRAVVVDGCFRAASQRALAKQLAEDFGHPFLFVEARVSDEVCRARLHERSVRDNEPESTWSDIAADLRSQWEPTGELPADQREVVDTALPLDHTARVLRARLPTWPEGLTD